MSSGETFKCSQNKVRLGPSNSVLLYPVTMALSLEAQEVLVVPVVLSWSVPQTSTCSGLLSKRDKKYKETEMAPTTGQLRSVICK